MEGRGEGGVGGGSFLQKEITKSVQKFTTTKLLHKMTNSRGGFIAPIQAC